MKHLSVEKRRELQHEPQVMCASWKTSMGATLALDVLSARFAPFIFSLCAPLRVWLSLFLYGFPLSVRARVFLGMTGACVAPHSLTCSTNSCGQIVKEISGR